MDKPKPIPPSIGIKLLSAGTAASLAEVATIPIDTVKVRLQIQGEGKAAKDGKKGAAPYRGIVRTLVVISREEGVRALYNGLTPGIHRQLVFASIRLGLYDSVKNFYIDLLDKDDPTHAYNPHIGLRILAGITTGALGVSCAQPTDVVKVRLQARSGGSGQRYTGTFNAYKTIAKQEGVRGLWKGILPNITRNSIVNACELVSYDMIKETLIKKRLMSDNVFCHFVSAFSAGFVSTCIASPVDVVKTRFMNSSPGRYKGAIDCAKIMYHEGGPLAFYKGFVPSFMRLGSWNIVMFISFEQLKILLGQAQQKHRYDKLSNRQTRAKVL